MWTHHEHTVGPPVSSGAVTFPVDDLWCHVLHSAAEGVRLLLVKYGLLAEPKVCQLDVAFRVQEDAGREKHMESVLSEVL